MWLVTTIEAKPIELDFRSSGQGRHTDTSLVAGGSRLVNAAGLVDYDLTDDRVQVEVCEDCGFTHCAPGGWVSLRRLGENVLWLPAFKAMSDGGPTGEYRPPNFMRERGPAFLDASSYRDLRGHSPVLPPLAQVLALSLREAVLVVQWEAPGRILGTYPEPPSLRKELIRAVDYGDRDRQVEALAQVLADSWTDTGHAVFRREAQQRSFYLDLPRHPAWSPVADFGEDWGLSLASSLGVSPPPRASA